MAPISIIYAILQMWLLRSLVQGQTAVLNGTNYVNGSGFCFGDQQLKEGTPFISCLSSGFTGDVAAYTVLWSINGFVLSESQVEAMYPDHIDAVTPQAGESRLNILNVTSLGVSFVACRIAAFDSGGGILVQTLLSTLETITVVNTVPAPEMPRITPSNTSAEVTVSKPSGLCEGLRSSQITYEFKVYRSNSLVTTENVTTSGPTASANLSGLSKSTEYRIEIRAIINVVSQSIPVSVAFNTLPEPSTTAPSPSPPAFIGAVVGGVVGGVALLIIVVCLVLFFIFCLKSRNSSSKDDQKKKSSLKKEGRSKGPVGGDVIYDDPSEVDAVQMQPSPAYATTLAVEQSDLDTSHVKIEPSPAYQDWYKS